MGLRDEKEIIRKQDYSYFCLENDYWRIIGLDTGTDSPLHHRKPGTIKDGYANLGLLPDQIDWLENEVKFNPGDSRGIIILSHHQPWGSFKEFEYKRPAEQLTAPNLIESDRLIIWFAPHEHHFGVYSCNTLANSVKIFLRCIGNGGMPIEIDNDKKPNNEGYKRLIALDERFRRYGNNKHHTRLGFNGFTFLTLDGAKLIVDYYDNNENDQSKFLSEEWNLVDGKLTGKIEEFKKGGQELTITKGKNLNDAVEN